MEIVDERVVIAQNMEKLISGPIQTEKLLYNVRECPLQSESTDRC